MPRANVSASMQRTRSVNASPRATHERWNDIVPTCTAAGKQRFALEQAGHVQRQVDAGWASVECARQRILCLFRSAWQERSTRVREAGDVTHTLVPQCADARCTLSTVAVSQGIASTGTPCVCAFGTNDSPAGHTQHQCSELLRQRRQSALRCSRTAALCSRNGSVRVLESSLQHAFQLMCQLQRAVRVCTYVRTLRRRSRLSSEDLTAPCACGSGALLPHYGTCILYTIWSLTAWHAHVF
jgi:hypothetical protein